MAKRDAGMALYVPLPERPHRWSHETSGWEMQCRQCELYWPCDSEFYPRRTRSNFPKPTCRACEYDSRRRSNERRRRRVTKDRKREANHAVSA